jgi:hypothetical protein
VYIVMSVYAAVALAWMSAVTVRISKWKRTLLQRDFPAPGWQLGIWAALVISGAIAWIVSWELACALLLLLAQFLPLVKRSSV